MSRLVVNIRREEWFSLFSKEKVPRFPFTSFASFFSFEIPTQSKQRSVMDVETCFNNPCSSKSVLRQSSHALEKLAVFEWNNTYTREFRLWCSTNLNQPKFIYLELQIDNTNKVQNLKVFWTSLKKVRNLKHYLLLFGTQIERSCCKYRSSKVSICPSWCW